MKYLLWAIIGLGLAAAIGSVPVESSYQGRSQLIQRVQRDEGAELFGDKGTPLGSPQQLIIEDPKAFVDGTGDDGAKLVDDKYLTDHKIYPLQMKSVAYVASMVRIGGGVAALLGAIGLWLLKRKLAVGVDQSHAS